MLKAIKKFVLDRLRDANIERRQVVEGDHPQAIGSVILRDGGETDIFVHGSALQRTDVTGLIEGQRVLVGVTEGRKGPEAISVQIIGSGSDNV